MGNDPPPTVEYATPARERRRASRAIIVGLMIALVLFAALAGVMAYLLVARSALTVQVVPAPPAAAAPGAPAAPAPAGPPTLSLPSDPFRLTLRQRETRSLQGSNDTIFLHVDDITRGQVLISLTGADGTPVVESTSARQGDSVPLTINGAKYVIDVLELHNTLTSGDFVVLSIATPGKRPTTATAPTTAPTR